MTIRRGSSRVALGLLTSVAVAALSMPIGDALAFDRGGGHGGGGMHMGGGGSMHMGGGGGMGGGHHGHWGHGYGGYGFGNVALGSSCWLWIRGRRVYVCY